MEDPQLNQKLKHKDLPELMARKEMYVKTQILFNFVLFQPNKFSEALNLYEQALNLKKKANTDGASPDVS